MRRSSSNGVSVSITETIRAVVLDLDGVMVDSETIALKMWYEFLANYGKALSDAEYRQMVGMEPGQYLNRDIDATLSGGERKRIEMASVLAMRPKLAILDEPDSGIDIVALPLLLNGIMEMNKQGSSVLLITHSEQVTEIAHRVSVLCAGKIINSGAPLETSQWFKNNCLTCPHINEPSH